MIRATISMKVKPGRQVDFEAAWHKIADHVRLDPANLRQALLRDPRDATVYVITSDWESADAFHRFEVSHRQDALVSPLAQLRESASLVIYDIVEYVGGGAIRG